MKTWKTTDEIWIDGNLVELGSEVSLSANQSKYIGHALAEPDPIPAVVMDLKIELSDHFEDDKSVQSKPRRQRLKSVEDGDID